MNLTSQSSRLVTLAADFYVSPRIERNRANDRYERTSLPLQPDIRRDILADRFDLTLECIRRFYANKTSPLEETLKRYSSFFRLFETFEGYARFFLLDDLIDEQGTIRFYLPFDDFQSPPQFRDVNDYVVYKSRVESFINARSRRIEAYAKQLKT